MPDGHRADDLAHNITRRVEARLDGEPVFAAGLHPAIAANPCPALPLRANVGGTLSVVWSGDQAYAHTESVALVGT
jgi:sulfur-oxidizing protein SoxZ